VTVRRKFYIGHRAKFGQNKPSGFGDIAIFRFWRWRPSAVLDFSNFKL